MQTAWLGMKLGIGVFHSVLDGMEVLKVGDGGAGWVPVCGNVLVLGVFLSMVEQHIGAGPAHRGPLPKGVQWMAQTFCACTSVKSTRV